LVGLTPGGSVVSKLTFNPDLESKRLRNNKAMQNYFFSVISLWKVVRKLSKINESSLSKIFASFKLAKITEN
jgi:hypothetical protein